MSIMSETLAVRWMRRYKVFFLLGLVILAIQIFLAYKSLKIPQLNISASFLSGSAKSEKNLKGSSIDNSVGDDEDINSNLNSPIRTKDVGNVGGPKPVLNLEQLGFIPDCEITTKEAISAIHRAKTKDCKKHIANITCLIQSGRFYARSLPSFCHHGNFTANKPLGCYKDEKEYRLLSGYYTNFKVKNSPKKCIQMCLQSGFPYAGVQYSTECFCGTEQPPTAAKLPDPSCNMKCPGDPREACGGYFSINIYETGISKFTPQIAKTVPKPEVERIRIAYLLTLNGRALRQVHRLIKALYSPNHVFYIHIDSRQDYLYRELLKLELQFHNIRLARTRFSTIWGGASLLTMLLQCMKDLLKSSWEWDFVINLSESDFPVKTNERLVEFLTANRGKNFVKSHGRETQRFIQKQGLDKTFVECDTHMWRIGERELPNGIQLDGGSDWIALSKEFVNYVTSDDPDELITGLTTIFRHTLLPAESFFHTVLRNSKFCGTYVDNNLHVTNWKRRLGCKCQYKHVVDWCGCSPNDFKPEDWARLLGTEHKLLFFARKFEPIINQAIILQLEEWLFGPYTSDYINLNSYWQSIYHYQDKSPPSDDAGFTIANSLIRINGRILEFQPLVLKEILNYKSNEEYKGFIIRYTAKLNNKTVELETRIRPNQSWQTARNSNFAKRIRNFDVSSEYDQKEQISRNFAKFIGPYTDLVLTFRFIGSEHAENHSYNLTVLWIDPTGSLQDFNEIHVEDGQTASINFSKATLKHPITPGIWTVKLIGRTTLFAQSRFLVTPLNFEGNQPIKQARSQIINLGSRIDISYPQEWRQYFSPRSDTQLLRDRVEANAERFGDALNNWIDGLVNRFFFIRETCIVVDDSVITGSNALLRCRNANWSTYAPDPKSDVYGLLNRRGFSTLSNLTSLTGSTDIVEKQREYMAVFPDVVKSLTEYVSKYKSKDAAKLYEKALKYNVLTGKVNVGFATVLMFLKIADETQLNPENTKLVYYLAWCIEMVASVGFIVDDIQDGSATRRGKPCWYKLEEIGLGAINDSLMIENGVYHILKENFAQKDYYVQLLELFHEVIFTAAIGQSIELEASKSCVTGFTMDKYKSIVANKTTNFIYLALESVMHLCGFSDPEIFRQLRAILYDVGIYMQVINDFNDCYGDPEKIGKIGSDIEENRYTWLAVVCMERASEAQKEIMRECYGKTDPIKVGQVKHLYEELGLPKLYSDYKEETINMFKRRSEQDAGTLAGHFSKIILPFMTSTNWADVFGSS